MDNPLNHFYRQVAKSPLALSPCHPLAKSPGHPLTLSPCPLVTPSPCRPLTATNQDLGMLINFGQASLDYKRIANTKHSR